MKNPKAKAKINLQEMMRFQFVKKENISRLPKKPGVYCFKNEEILYIGKATDVRSRVKNHFQSPGFKESVFLEKTKRIGFIKTRSEIEALILEARLIKKCQPKYNVMWKDDKNYFFIGITKENFPQVFWTHQIQKLKNKNSKLKIDYIGPFIDGKALKQTLKILRKVFPCRSCKNLLTKPCLWYHIARCPAPCLIKTKSAEQIPFLKKEMGIECKKNAKNIFEIFKKGRTKVLSSLKKEMKKLSGSQKFERAAKTRDQIIALERVISHARLFEIQVPSIEVEYNKIKKELKRILNTKKKIERIESYDVSNIQGKKATGSMVAFIKGELVKSLYRRFKIKFTETPNDLAMIKETLLRRLKHTEWGLPDFILIDGGQTQLNTVLKIVENKNILVAAIAKRKSEFYLKGRKPLLLKNLPREIFNLILQLRDEAHRFAINYHKKLRKKEILTPLENFNFRAKH